MQPHKGQRLVEVRKEDIYLGCRRAGSGQPPYPHNTGASLADSAGTFISPPQPRPNQRDKADFRLLITSKIMAADHTPFMLIRECHACSIALFTNY